MIPLDESFKSARELPIDPPGPISALQHRAQKRSRTRIVTVAASISLTVAVLSGVLIGVRNGQGEQTIETATSAGTSPISAGWVEIPAPFGAGTPVLTGTANGSGAFAVVAQDAGFRLSYSSNVTDWELRGQITPGDVVGPSITAISVGGDGRIVAVGGSGGRAAAWHSSDGGWTWSSSDIAIDSSSASAVAATSDGFVAVGNKGDAPVAWLSSDGESWDPIDLPPPSAVQGFPSSIGDARAVAEAGDAAFVGGHVNGRPVLWSIAGGTATPTLASEESGSITALAVRGESLLIGGSSSGQPALWERASAGGLAPVETNLTGDPTASPTVSHLAATTDGVAAILEGAAIDRAELLTSTDLADWTSITTATPSVGVALVSTDGSIVAIGRNVWWRA